MTSAGSIPLEPQSSIAQVLRPPDSFEQLYEGAPRLTPLPFVNRNQNGEYVTRDDRVGQQGISANLARYVPVPLGATIYILIPRAFYFTDQLLESVYQYELRWRLRTSADWRFASAQGNPSVPYHLQAKDGAPESTAPNPSRIVLPSFTSELLTPTAPGSGQRPLVEAPDVLGVATQGLLDPVPIGPGTAFSPNNYFPPIIRRALADELSVVAYRGNDPATWEFAGADGGFSNIYGTNLAGATQHEQYKAVGVILISLAASPAA